MADKIYDFEDILQKDYTSMTEGEWRMAVAAMFFRIQKQQSDTCEEVTGRLDVTNGTVKVIPTIQESLKLHNAHIIGLWAVTGTVGIALLIAVAKLLIGF